MSEGTLYRVTRLAGPVESLLDRRLSWEAKGLMAYLLAQKEGWIGNNDVLLTAANASPTRLARIKSELISAGYLYRHRAELDGQGAWVMEVYESPALNHHYVEAIAAERLTENEKRLTTLQKPEKKGGVGGGQPVSPPQVLKKPAEKTNKQVTSLKDSLKTVTGTSNQLPVPVRGENPTLTKNEQDGIRKFAELEFARLTSLTVPLAKPSAAALWYAPLREICDLAHWDEERIAWLIAQALLRSRGITVKSPKSILNAAKSVTRENPVPKDEGWTQLGSKDEEDEGGWTPL